MPSTIRGDDNFDSAEVIGQNQTWTDVTGSRAASTEYTNSTGRPIQVAITLNTSGPGARTLTIGGSIVIVRNIPNATNSSVCFDIIIPDGVTYELNGTFTSWFELR